MKRISIIIIVAMVMQLFSGLAPVFTEDGPTPVFAEGTIVGTYNLGPAGSETDVTGTLYSDGKLVIEGAGPIPDWSFYQNTSIKEVVIEGGITSIGQYAFQGCTSLTSVTISDTVKYISGYAFYSCISLESVVIGEGVANIYSSAFTECSALSTITNHFKGNQNLLNDPFKNAGSSSGTKTAYAYAANTKFTSAAETAGYTIVYLDTYTVSFNSNGGIAVDDITGVSHGSKITAPAPAPTKPGYTFAGWYKESALTNAWDFDTDTVTQDITLYAGWTAIDYSADYEIIGDPAIYMLSGNVLTIGAGASGSTITIKGTMTEETIAIANGVTNLTLILDGVSITSTSNPPIDLQGNADVTVELADGTTNLLDASSATTIAGLHVSMDASLIITGTGFLTVEGGTLAAGIGGDDTYSGTITINNGTITATGGAGAGIGGGQGFPPKAITINGGIITASSAKATGIGGGNQGGISTITINGGIINARSGNNGGAGIGSGWNANGGTIIINGGTIAASAVTGAGIGSGFGSPGSKITIGDSADVTAVSGAKPAIDATSPSSGTAINAELAGAIDSTYDVYIKMDSLILTLPKGNRNFAFSAASGSDIVVYSDKDCKNLKGRIITASGDIVIPVTDLSVDPTNVTQVRFQTLLSDSKVTISGINGSYNYTGSPLTPEPTVKFGAVALIKDTDYTLSYSNNTDVGTAKITLNFIGKYYGTAEKTFTIELNQYTVTFKDWNGSVIETQTVNHGSNATAPADPSRTGYTFADWDAAFTNVTSDLTVTATYAINQYTITFDSNGGSVVASITQNYDSDITAPDNPNKTGYTFNNWTPALPAKMPAESKTHTAQWAADTYNITYNLDGGTNNGANPATYTIETATITLQNPIKTGYTFDGWYDAEIDGNGVTHIISGSTGHKTLYARWTLNQYTVTFKDHDGDTLKTETVNHGSDATAPADPSRTGYTFAGWDAAFTNVTSDLTVTATYAINQYTITFDSNGGSVVASITQNYDSDITAPDNPNKTGYTFNNWTPALPAKMPAESKTHTAQWAADTYNITYNLDGGTNNGANPATYTIETATITLQNPIKTGYTFDGWYDAEIDGNGVTHIISGSTGHKTLYARWTLNQYTVTFKDHDGDTLKTETVNHGSDATAPADPSRTGYTFAGWDAAFTNVTSDLIVTATYAVNQYTITFDSAGGSAVAAITQNYGTAVIAPADPTKPGYTFNGWNPVLPATMPAENKTYTAQWTINTYNITYNLDGGTNNGANPANYTIETATITLQNPIKTGYTFDGWYDAEIDGNGVTHIISGSTGHKTLYARWTLNQYTVTFKDHDGDTLKTETVNHGSDATAPADLSRTGYTFADWDAAFTNVTSDLTVTATYAINQYTITFDSNGGSVVASITQNYDSDITAPDNPNKTGYTFNNWTPALPAKMPAESKTHTAQWAADTYNITYNLGGGINSDVNPAAYDIVTPTIILQLPTKTGYNFAGWWSTPFGGTQVAQIASGSTGDIILYALWTPKHNTAYKVEHYQQDVSGASYTIKDTDNLAGATAATATAFARIYTGFTENTAHGSRVASGTIAGDGTLVLKLYYDRSTYDVSFNSNGGSAVYDTTGVRHGATISAPVAPTKTGYTFAGWYKDSGLTTEWDFALDTVTANTTLYAKWTGNAYNVTFDGNYGGDLSTSNKSVPYGDIYGELATVSRTGYTFNGWFTEASGGTKIETGTTVNTANDHTLYAQWTINTYNITYNLDGGTNDAENVSIYTIETATISLKDATKTGYSFDGWYDADIDGNEVTHIILGSTGHKTLYARWTINQYTVTYKDHDGTILKTETVNHGSNATAPDDPTRTGYIFAGWDAAFTNVTSDLIVTATYSINQYTLTYTAGANGAITGFATQTVDHGADGTEVTAVPDGGYHFVKWSDDSTINPRIDTNITVDISIEAVFDRNSSSGRPTPLAPSAGTGMDILVNGKTETGATASTTTEGNQTVTTVVLDDQKVEEKLKKEGNNSVVTIPVDTGANVVVGALNGQTVKNMEDKESVLEIKTGQVTYTLPASQINITSVSEEIGTRVELKDIAVSVKISEPAPDTVQIVEDTADKNNYQIVVKPIEFEITCSSGGKTVGVSRFNAYVERLIAIPDGVDPSKVTTGVILNSDGTFSHVPTVITVIDGKYYAKINSLTNSIYSIVYSPKTFKDVENHWAKEAVNDMGSRLVISGVGNDNFEPDRGISRAEFAAIIVRALGLMNPGTGEDAFKDVAGNTWYYDAVSIAFKYGIISGYTNNKFGPHDKITREQAMTIVANAMKITDLDAGLTDREVVKVLARFTDTKNVAGYAKEPIAACIKTGIVSGKGNDIVAPKAPITRAEVALIVRMLLQKSNMIN